MSDQTALPSESTAFLLLFSPCALFHRTATTRLTLLHPASAPLAVPTLPPPAVPPQCAVSVPRNNADPS